jgi:hypothetical protein
MISNQPFNCENNPDEVWSSDRDKVDEKKSIIIDPAEIVKQGILINTA